MKYLFLVTVIQITIITSVQAQYKIKGVITNPQDELLKNVQISCITPSDTLFYLTGKDGTFHFTTQNAHILLSFSIYTSKLKDSFFVATPDTDLGKIVLKTGQLLDEVIVKGDPNAFTFSADRITQSIEHSLFSKGYTINNLVTRFPGILISNGTLTQIGTGEIGVLINGRQLKLKGRELLSFISGIYSDDIEKIELIQYGGSTYTADQSNVFINIVYKRNAKERISGNLHGSHTQNYYSFQNLGGSIAYQRKRFNLFFSAEAYRGDIAIDQEKEMAYTRWQWQGKEKTKKAKDPLQAVLHGSLQLTPNAVIGWQASALLRRSPESSTGTYYFDDPVPYISHNTATTRNSGERINTLLYYTQTVRADLSFDVEWDFIDSRQYSDRSIHMLTTDHNAAVLGSSETRNDNDQRMNNHTLQWKWKYRKSIYQLQWGVYWSKNAVSNAVNFEISQPPTQESSYFSTGEEIMAAFAQYDTKWKAWTVQTGLRWENTHMKGTENYIHTQYNNRFDNLFPSVNLFRPLQKGASIRLSYTKSILRPRFADLTTFRWYHNQQVYEQGNPFLQPEIKHFIQATWRTSNSYMVGLYYARQNNGQAKIFKIDTTAMTQITQPQNFFDLNNIGGYVSKSYMITPKINSFNTAYLYYNNSVFKNEYATMAEPLKGFAFLLISNNSFSLKNNWTVHLNAMIDPPRKAIYFKTSGGYSLDISIDKRWANKPYHINFMVSDVFNSFIPTHTFLIYNIPQKVYYNASNRYARISFHYSFGNKTVKGKTKSTMLETQNERFN